MFATFCHRRAPDDEFRGTGYSRTRGDAVDRPQNALGVRALQHLKAHRDRSTRKSDDDLVFPNKSGERLRESKLLERALQPAAERAGLGRVTWHQFRHIHSSLLNDLRVPVKIAQEQLGHTSIQTTLQHLHARRRCFAPCGDRTAGAAVVPNCSQIAGSGRCGRVEKR
jgi:site-specific recombinase XerC